MNAAFYTFGCKLNQLETEALASAFRCRGFFIVPWKQEADIYVINTCTVTSKSEQKARRVIRKLQRDRPKSVIIVTGCYVELEEKHLREDIRGPVYISQRRKPDFFAALDNGSLALSAEEITSFLRLSCHDTDPFIYKPREFQFHSRPSLKIQDGCDNRCAYCRVPLARGNSVSIRPERAIEGLLELEEKGYNEAIITGVNISSYNWEGTGLGLLLERFLNTTKRIRLRLSSMEPDMCREDLLDVLADPRIRPHFHLPIQSGSDRILKLMKRKYLSDTVREVVFRFRSVKKDPFIAGDVIVGFPGESDTDYVKTRELIMELKLAKMHVFQFSPRPGTSAFSMPGKVPDGTIKERSRELIEDSKVLFRSYVNNWLQKETEAVYLREEHGQKRVVTENNLDAVCKDSSGELLQPGDLCSVLLQGMGKTVEGSIAGSILKV